MKKDIKSILDKLEQIEENQLGQLNGGFASFSLSSGTNLLDNATNNCKKGACHIINNCHGANCGPSCGNT